MSRLIGKRVVITRAAHQAAALAHLLRERGALPVFYPCIAVVPTEDSPALAASLCNLTAFDWLIVTSSNTVEALRTHMVAWPAAAAPQIAAVGGATAAALHDVFGVEAAFIPDVQTAEQLAEHLPIAPGVRVLLPQSARARPDLARRLTERGAHVTAITAYQTVIGMGGDDVPGLLKQGEIDAVTFTSPSTVTFFVQRVRDVPLVLAACIGEVTAQAARDSGFRQVVMPHDYTLNGLITVLEEYVC